jgi:hypothetical protein
MDLEDRKLTSQGGDEPKARASAREARPWSREDNKLHAEGSGCPQLHRPAATGQRWSPFTTTRSYGASWRTRRSRRTGRWLPARYGASRRSADSTGAWPARSVVLRARRDPSTSAEAPIWRHHRDATARRSGADDLCSRSGAFRVFRERARSAVLGGVVSAADQHRAGRSSDRGGKRAFPTVALGRQSPYAREGDVGG